MTRFFRSSVFIVTAVFAAWTAPLLADDKEEIRQIAADYVHGFYKGEAELLDRVLSEELKKLGWYRQGTNAYGGPYYMPKETALSFAPDYAAREQLPDDAHLNVTIFEVLDKTASVKIEAVWGIDYMHLAKVEDQWKIYNIIWQSWPDGRERK